MPGHHSAVRPQPRTWRSAAHVALLALALSLAIAVTLPSAAPPAHAGCTEIEPAQAREQADAVVEGTVVARQSPGIMVSSSDPVQYTVEVGRVYATTGAAVQERIEVTAPYSYGLGGEASRWLLFLRGENPTFETDACSAVELPIANPAIADEVAGWESREPEPGGVEMPGRDVPWWTIALGAAVLGMLVILVRAYRRTSRT